jgi:protein ImuB
VLRTPWAAEVVAATGHPVALDERGTLTAEPARFRPGPDDDWQPVAAWAGPWPVEELWWEAGGRKVARFQVVGVDGSAWLLTLDGDVWWTEAGYD